MDVYNPSENKLDVALTRIDKVNQTCDAALLTARVVTEDLDFLEPFEFQVNGGQLMTTGGIDDTDGTLSIISSSTLTSVVSPSGLFISVNATPVRCNIGGTAEISYINGTAPYTYIWSTGENTASVSGLNIGTHQVTVTDADGLQAVLDFDIEWTFTSIRARTDSGKICIDLENAPLTEAIGISIDNGNTYMSPVTTNVCYDVPEGDYQVWAQQADLQCPVYLDSLHVLIDDIVIIDSTPSTIELFNTLGSESQIECNLNRSGDMHVYLYNTHGQLYYIHVQFTTKNHPLINKILKLPVMK